MKAGNLSESEGSDAFWVPLYSSIYLRESHVQGNRFDLENPGLEAPSSSQGGRLGWGLPRLWKVGDGAFQTLTAICPFPRMYLSQPAAEA